MYDSFNLWEDMGLRWKGPCLGNCQVKHLNCRKDVLYKAKRSLYIVTLIWCMWKEENHLWQLWQNQICYLHIKKIMGCTEK